VFDFRSDNNAGLCPEALEAIVQANDGAHRAAYGEDEYTVRASTAFRKIFQADVEVFFVATGTAANTLAVAALTEPWQQVLCHTHSHYNADESTAPERITHCRTVVIPTTASKIVPDDIGHAGAQLRGDVHEPQAGVLTLSNPTEFGTVYTPQETAELCAIAHEHGYRVHVDGARFANAVASVGCTPAALSGDAGVDALSFGGTKNGLAFGEAIVFFPQGDGAVFRRACDTIGFHRKGTGHLLSKHRFIAAPFAATLTDGSWLRHATHANAMATRLSVGLAARGVRLCFPTEANGVFIEMTADLQASLSSTGHLPFGDAAWNMRRLMASFDTTVDHVDGLLADIDRTLR
jgi:threonine aldolase